MVVTGGCSATHCGVARVQRGAKAQPGTRPGSQGRLLPGLGIHERDDGIEIRGLAPEEDTTVFLSGLRLDDEGFLVTR